VSASLQAESCGRTFSYAYQPLIDLRTRRIVGAEASLRWYHPTKGVVTPGTFIDIAEDTGLIVPIGRRVFQADPEGCDEQKHAA
jgi:EAL domain-containing protein (putative c-di-GMP-specific phosphodiesterase class I)